MKKIVKFTHPELKEICMVNQKLQLKLDWGDEVGTSIICRNVNGFNYKDVEYEFERFFKSPEFMIYEYNLPITVEILKQLPVLNEKNSIFIPSSRMIEDFDNLLDKINNGHNNSENS